MDSLFKKRKRIQIVLAVLLVLMSIVFSIRYAKAPFYHKRADQHYLTRANFTDGTNSPGDAFNTKWLSKAPEKRKDKIEVFSGSAKIKITEYKSTSYSLTVDSKENSKILINTAYFPGWIAEVNGKKTNVENYKGKMMLKLPSRTNNIRIFLDSTPIQKLSYVYSLLSVFTLAILPLGAKLIHPTGGRGIRLRRT